MPWQIHVHSIFMYMYVMFIYLYSTACLYNRSSEGVNLFCCSSSIVGRKPPSNAAECDILLPVVETGTGSLLSNECSLSNQLAPGSPTPPTTPPTPSPPLSRQRLRRRRHPCHPAGRGAGSRRLGGASRRPQTCRCPERGRGQAAGRGC